MMKAIVFTCLSLFIVMSGFSQNVRLSSQSVSNERNRILYVGIENVFIVTDTTTTGIEKQDLVELTGNKLVIKPMTTGYLTVTFLKKDDKAQVIFYVRNIPDVKLAPGNQPGPKVMKDSLVANGFLGYITDKNDGYFQGYEVASFTASLNGQTYVIAGRDFSDPLKAAILKAKSGDNLVVSQCNLNNEKLKKPFVYNGPHKFTIEK
jgi:hypothetical protein